MHKVLLLVVYLLLITLPVPTLARSIIITDENDTIHDGGGDVIIDKRFLQREKMKAARDERKLKRKGVQPASVSVILKGEYSVLEKLSHDGLTAYYAGAGASTNYKATRSVSAGKWYFEGKLKVRGGELHPDTWTTLGLAPANGDYIDPYGFSTSVMNVLSVWPNTAILLSDSVNDGDIFGIAFDIDAQKAYIRYNGEWVYGDPEKRVGGHVLKGKAYVPFVAVSASSENGGSTDEWRINFGSSEFHSPLPVGYKAYDTQVPPPSVKTTRRSMRAK